MRGAKIWVPSKVLGQTVLGCRRRPFRALWPTTNPHFGRQVVLKSKPEVRLKKGRRNQGAKPHDRAASLRVPKAAFRAFLAASNPHFCRGMSLLKKTRSVP